MRRPPDPPAGAPDSPPAPRIVRRESVDDADRASELLRRADGIDRRFVQVERGRFRNVLDTLELGEATLVRSSASPGYSVASVPPPGSQALFLVRTGSGVVRWCGRDLTPGSFAMSRPGDEHPGRVFGSLELFNLAYRRDAFVTWARAIGRPELEERLAVAPWPAPSPGLAAAVERRLAALLARAAALAAPPSGELRRRLVTALFTVVAAVLTTGAGAPPIAPPRARREAVARVRELVRSSWPEVPAIPALCVAAGVSQRTLEYAFREHLGLSPAQFLKLSRLNAARAALRAAPGARVTDVALEYGFGDAGHFARHYAALFGERPSDTRDRADR